MLYLKRSRNKFLIFSSGSEFNLSKKIGLRASRQRAVIPFPPITLTETIVANPITV